MRFVFFIPNLAGGGAERVVSTIAERLARQGHQVHLLLCEMVFAYVPPSEVVLESLLRPGERFSSGILGKIGLALRLRSYMRRIFGKEPPDYFVASLPFSYEICSLARISNVVFHVHNTLSVPLAKLAIRHPGKATRQRRRLVRQFRDRRLIAVSQGVANDLCSEFDVPADHIDVVYNPFDLNYIRDRALERSPEVPKESFILFAGRNAQQKRLDLLIRAFSLMNGPERLFLLTDADDYLVKLISTSSRAEQIFVVGFKPNPYAWMAAAELLVLCSDWEGFGNVLVEALACGTRVVATNCPSGPSEILTGVLEANLVPVNDAEALAGRMTKALTEPRPEAVDLSRFSIDAATAAFQRLAKVTVGDNVSGRTKSSSR